MYIGVNRDKLKLTFSALVVKIMSTDVLAGTGFHVENDVYSRMATDLDSIDVVAAVQRT